ncbi:MAG: hypothetical protein U9Q66_02955 [Patescibacteria group bacterium]|nr:hypothetical protein [Patescibacteria group bacterium]
MANQFGQSHINSDIDACASKRAASTHAIPADQISQSSCSSSSAQVQAVAEAKSHIAAF